MALSTLTTAERRIETLPDHLSFSQANMWLRCQRQHWFRYGQGRKVPPSGAMVVGSAAHKAIEHDNISKASGYRDPASVVLDVYGETFQREAPDAVWDGETPGAAKDRGYAAVETYCERYSHRVQPAGRDSIEKKVSIPLPGAGCDLLGYVDCVDAKGRVFDYKTTGRRPSGITDDTQLQLWLYGYALGKMGVAVRSRRVVYLVAKVKGAEVIPYRVGPAAPSTLARWLVALEQIRASIEEAYTAGRFLPALPGSWWCSATGCGFWDLCQREF